MAVADTVAFELAGTPSIGGSAEGAGVGAEAETCTAVAPGGNLARACFAFACVLRTGAKASAADHPERLTGEGGFFEQMWQA